MAHFLTTVTGTTYTEKSITGSKSSGMKVHIRGWDLGIRIFIIHNEKESRDEVSIYLTGGSHSSGNKLHVGHFVEGRKLSDEECCTKIDPRLRIGEARTVEEI